MHAALPLIRSSLVFGGDRIHRCTSTVYAVAVRSVPTHLIISNLLQTKTKNQNSLTLIKISRVIESKKSRNYSTSSTVVYKTQHSEKNNPTHVIQIMAEFVQALRSQKTRK